MNDYTPRPLAGVLDRMRTRQDGRARSLDEVLTKWHNPDDVVGKGALTPEERADLIAFLKTL